MKKYILYNFCALISLIFTSCKKETTSTNSTSSSTVDVYIAGWVNDFGQGYDVCYWKNGVKVYLPFSSPGFPTSMCVSGGDVYIAGGMEDALHTTDTAVYWKNGIQVQYSSPAWATGITVSGSDVYMSGTYWNGNAFYWKNGVVTNLGPGTANAIAVSGNDIYVLGSSANYWKNGVANTLVASSRANTSAIAVSGNDVYAAGQIGNSAVYWKNGVPTTLAANANALAIVISGNDVYVAGIIATTGSNVAVYWKNGVLTNLQSPVAIQNPLYSMGIAVSGNDVYVAGCANIGAPGGPPNTNAVYWKNGVLNTLGSGAANAIALVTH